MAVIRRVKKQLSDEEIKKVENFVGGSESKVEQPENEAVKEEEVKAETVKAGQEEKADNKDYKIYSMRIPTDVYEKIEYYVFKNKRKGANIRKFIYEAIMDKIEKENL